MTREVEQLTSMTQDVLDNLSLNLWKVFPWSKRNRAWMGCVLQAYAACNFAGFLLACVLNSLEGQAWLASAHNHYTGHRGGLATGKSALDECFWYVFTTMHGIAFGEFIPQSTAGHWIAMLCCSIGYWFIIFLCCIVMLAQLPGEKVPTFYSTLCRMISAVWPSYLVFIALIVI